MLMLSILHSLLSQVLAPPNLHTAVLFTTSGELVSATSEPLRPKDEIRIVVGLSGEVWQETKEQGYGMVDCELGKIIVIPIDDSGDVGLPFADDRQPLMLLALNATDVADWEELVNKGKILACHLAKPLSQFREHIAVPKSSASSTKAMSPVHTRSR